MRARLFLITALMGGLVLGSFAACRSNDASTPEELRAENEALERECDELKLKVSQLLGKDPRLAGLPETGVRVGVPTALARVLIQRVFAGFVDSVTLKLSNLKVKKAGKIKKVVTIGEYDLVVIVIGIRTVGNTIIAEAHKKVQHDLASAWIIYQEKLNRIQDVLNLTAKRDLIIRGIMGNQVDLLKRELERVRMDYGRDVLTVVDRKGVVLPRTRSPYCSQDFKGNDELVRRALRKEIVASTEIIPQDDLVKEGLDLARQAYMEFVPTPKAKGRPEDKETAGMMMKAAVPILAINNEVWGVIYGGNFLNRNYEIVDKITDAVFRGER